MPAKLSRRAWILTAAVALALAAVIGVGARIVCETAPPTARSADGGYRLGTWEGKLALFAGDEAAPQEVYDVWIASLPEPEQARLTAGIAVPDQQTLWRLLEDYTS